MATFIEDGRPSRATGSDIIRAVVANMRQGLEPLFFSVVPPTVYDVYLRAEDYRRLSGILPTIISEAKRALDDAQEELGKRSFFSRFRSSQPPLATPLNWIIEVHQADEDDLEPDAIVRVDSRLSLPPTDTPGSAETQRIVTTSTGTETRTVRLRDEKPVPPRPLARLTYQDGARQRREYVMVKREIVVGRGSPDTFCDLTLDGPMDVSRQHFYLRLDETAFRIQDVSTYGTTVDGRLLKRGEWQTMPRKARIVLAQKIPLEFEAVG